MQLEALEPGLERPDSRAYGKAFLRLASRPWTLACLPLYAAILGIASALARRRFRRGDFGGWDRDESARLRH
jgi:hypothetical protein